MIKYFVCNDIVQSTKNSLRNNNFCICITFFFALENCYKELSFLYVSDNMPFLCDFVMVLHEFICINKPPGAQNPPAAEKLLRIERPFFCLIKYVCFYCEMIASFQKLPKFL